MKKEINYISGFIIGVINVVVGACGGIVAVESLKRNGLDQTHAQATAISIMLPLTVISSVLYLCKGNLEFTQSTIFLIPGIIGGFVGAKLLPKISKQTLSKFFAVFIIYAGVRMFIK